MDKIFKKDYSPDFAKQITKRICEMPNNPENISQLLKSLKLVGDKIEVPNEIAKSNNVLAFLHSVPESCAVWEPDPQNPGGFHRREGLEFCDPIFAASRYIPPRSDKKRIVLLGESVARGFLLDPGFTPSQCLEQMLTYAEIPGGIEVIDLAMNGVKLYRGVTLANRAVEKLRPDIMIMFSGNNISLNNIMAPKEIAVRRRNIEYIRKNGIPAFNQYLKHRIVDYIHKYIDSLVNLNTPLLFIIPDSNLVDWKFVDDVPAPWIDDTANTQWMDLYLMAIKALENKQLKKAEMYSVAMMEIDQGTSSSSANILRESLFCQGRLSEAEHITSESLSSTDYCNSLLICPRTRPVVRESLKSALSKKGIPFIDMKDVLSSDGKNPGRKAFLDYCHLNSYGIRKLMAQVAHKLSPQLGGRIVPIADFKNIVHSIDRSVEGASHFLAAIHNAHWGQEEEIISHHIKRALDIWPEISEIMRLYIEISSGNIARWMHKSTPEFLACANDQLIRYLWRFDSVIRFDGILLETMAKFINTEGMDFREKLKHNRQENFARMNSNNSSGLDLTLRYYAPHESAIEFREFSPILDLYFPIYERLFSVPKNWSNLCLMMTIRTVDIVPGKGLVYINQIKVSSFSVEEEWQNYEIFIPTEVLRPGRNKVCIKLPKVIFRPNSATKRFYEAIDCLDTKNFFPILMQISRLILINNHKS